MQILHLHSYLKLSFILTIISCFSFFYTACNNSTEKNEKTTKINESQSTNEQVEVWPGDADNNGIVSIVDLLSIGLLYEKKGTERANANIQFKPQIATKWGINLPNDADIAHIDCNGDGIINDKDTLAITTNFNRRHENHNDSFKTDQATNLIFAVTTTIITCPETVEKSWRCKEIKLKMTLENIDKLYGLTFGLKYNKNMKILSIETDTPYCGLESDDYIDIIKKDNTKQEIYFGFTSNEPSNGNVECKDIGSITMQVAELDEIDSTTAMFSLIDNTADLSNNNIISLLNNNEITFAKIDSLKIR